MDKVKDERGELEGAENRPHPPLPDGPEAHMGGSPLLPVVTPAEVAERNRKFWENRS